MTPTYHPDAAVLRAYAAGQLHEAFDLIVATHLSLCADCRAVVARESAAQGSALEEATPVALKPDALERTLARIEAAEKPPPQENGHGQTADQVLNTAGWRPVGMGIKQAILSTARGAQARLMHIPAGVALPAHSHRSQEMTLVLQGAFEDSGRIYRRGDFALADGTLSHRPRALPGGDCICMIATDAPLRFQSWLPRVVQRFLRI